MKVQVIATLALASLADVVLSKKTKTLKLSAENVNWGFFSKTVPPAAYINSGEGKLLWVLREQCTREDFLRNNLLLPTFSPSFMCLLCSLYLPLLFDIFLITLVLCFRNCGGNGNASRL